MAGVTSGEEKINLYEIYDKAGKVDENRLYQIIECLLSMFNNECNIYILEPFSDTTLPAKEVSHEGKQFRDYGNVLRYSSIDGFIEGSQSYGNTLNVSEAMFKLAVDRGAKVLAISGAEGVCRKIQHMTMEHNKQYPSQTIEINNLKESLPEYLVSPTM